MGINDLRVEVLDAAGNWAYDSERTLDRAMVEQFVTEAPGGFADCQITIRRRKPFLNWDIRAGQQVRIYNGLTPVYEGDIEDIVEQPDGSARLEVFGRQWMLDQRLLRKIWVDTSPYGRLINKADTSDDSAVKFQVARGDDYLRANFRGVDTRGSALASDFVHQERYWTVGAGNIRRIEFDLKIRTGEGGKVNIFNVAAGSLEASIVGSGDTTVSGDTNVDNGLTDAIDLKLGPSNNEAEYTKDDWISLVDLTVYFHFHPGHSSYGFSPGSLTAKKYIEDILRETDLLGNEVSSDLGGITDPGLEIKPFGGYQTLTARQHITKALRFGDGGGGIYFYYVWSSAESNDGRPLFTVQKRIVSSAKYIIDGNDQNVQLNYRWTLDSLANYISVEFEDDDGQKKRRTPNDNAALKNTVSIASYFRRDKNLDIGAGTASSADDAGKTYLAQYGDRRLKGSADVAGMIRLANGGVQPVCRVRAGETAYVPQFDTIIFIGRTRYDPATETMTIDADEEPDRFEAWLLRKDEVVVR